MMYGGEHSTQAVFLLLLFIAAVFAAFAQRVRVPYPIVLVCAGLAVGFVPGLPEVELDPDMVFFVFLPLLLYWAAWQTSWVSLVRNAGNVASLAIGLVVFTVAGIALLAPLFLPGFDWRTGLILGAVIAPTDAIAATAIARRLGLQKRLVDIIEDESLVNDATGLFTLQVGLAIFTGGHLPTVGDGVVRFSYMALGGVAAGVVLAFAVERLERRIDEAAIVIAITIFIPYAAYFAGEAMHASGVLAVVACGLFHSRRADEFRSARVRLEASVVWNALAFILNGLLFVLIGLQLRPLLRTIRGTSLGTIAVQVLIFSVLVLSLRLLWVLPAMAVANVIHRRRDPALSFRSMFVVGWSSMRGVIALAAAMSLPHSVPQRSIIIFLTFGAIFVSLVLKGATLPALIRRLGLAGSAEPEVAEIEARRIVLASALQQLDAIREKGGAFDEHYDDLRRHYGARLAALEGAEGDEHGTALEHVAQYRDLTRQLLEEERRAAVQLRNEHRISDEVLRDLLDELDLEQNSLSRRSGRGSG